MRGKRKPNKKALIIITAAAFATAVIGVWLLFAPSRERDYIYAMQESMIEDLLLDIAEAETALYEAEGMENAAGLSYEDSDDVEAAYSDALSPGSASEAVNEAIYIEETAQAEYADNGYEAYIQAYEPIPDNAFPDTIIGIGILTIESIDLRLPIAEGVDERTLRIAPGRVPQTAQIGEVGNAVIAGHRNYTFGSMFNRLGELDIGDRVQYQARNGEIMAFEVFEIAVIEPHDQIAFLQPVNDSIITLYTCTPIRSATHRLIIRAQRTH